MKTNTSVAVLVTAILLGIFINYKDIGFPGNLDYRITEQSAATGKLSSSLSIRLETFGSRLGKVFEKTYKKLQNAQDVLNKKIENISDFTKRTELEVEMSFIDYNVDLSYQNYNEIVSTIDLLLSGDSSLDISSDVHKIKDLYSELKKNINLAITSTKLVIKDIKEVKDDDLSDFSKRASKVIDDVAAVELDEGVVYGKFSPHIAMANFAKYEETGLQKYLDKAILYSEKAIDGGGAMFRIYNMAILYSAYNHLFTEGLKNDYKTVLVGYNSYGGGSTSNHKLMYRAAAILAYENWPNDFNKNTYKKSLKHMNEWFEYTTANGYWEYDSDVYFIHHTGPIMSLATYSNQSELRNRALMTFEWYLASAIGELNKGYMMTTSSRDKNPSYGPLNSSDSTALFWLLFGEGVEPKSELKHHLGHVQFAISGYEPPTVFKKIVADRNFAYTHLESHLPGCSPSKTTYMNLDYGVYSQIDNGNTCKEGNRWGVKWVDGGKDSTTFYMKKPIGSNDYNSPEYAEGIDGSQQVLQHKGTIVTVDKLKDSATDWIEGPLSKNIKEIVEEEGWIFMNTGSVYIAAKPINGYTRPSGNYAGHAKEGRIKSTATKNGVVVETAPDNDFVSLNDFKRAILSTTSIDSTGINNSNPGLTFTNLNGDKLEITFNGDRKINGEKVNSSGWPILSNPWMQQDKNGNLNMSHGSFQCGYNFDTWTKTCSL